MTIAVTNKNYHKEVWKFCPKCKRANVIREGSIIGTRNRCLLCGCSHELGASRESLERQINPAWINPRLPVAVNGTRP